MWIVWVVLPIPETMSVKPIPTSVSFKNLPIVSLVMLLRTSLTTTSPITDADAVQTVSSGSDSGLSRLICG